MPTCTPIFTESQRFRQWWLWAIVIPGPVFLIWATIAELFRTASEGGGIGTVFVLALFTLLFGIVLPAFLFRAGLETEVYEDVVRVRFIPIHRNWQSFEFISIDAVEAKTYRPIRDYGGWGIRYGGPGKAYNVSGNHGVLLDLADGTTLMIGSQRPEELAAAIRANGTEGSPRP